MKKLKSYDEIPTFVDVDNLCHARLGKCMGYVLEKNLSEEEKKKLSKKILKRTFYDPSIQVCSGTYTNSSCRVS